MARRRKSAPTWVLVLVAIAVAVGYYLQQRAERARIGDAVVVGADDPAAKRPAERPTADARTPAGGPRAPEENVGLGEPAPAAGTPEPDLVIRRSQCVIGYDRDRGIPLWVAWHLDAGDLGGAERSKFAPDPELPAGWYRVTPNDYRNSGYDRGHMVPSADRSASPAENAPTFYMTNIIPQAADNNQGPWADFENYCRDLARKGNELYVVAGGAGPFVPIAGGKVFAPATTWKAVLVLPEGDDDVARVGATTRTIAISMPNAAGIRERDWREFVTSVDAVEALAGLDLFAALDDQVEGAIENRLDR